ncbi:hypothetical protein SAMN05192530_10266 [Aureimonas jatrophae]|uniref:Uncharacterized protein n=1 Tax=Aureimonas jatrophae TaxID=1166073 RepID=A0A1H0EJI5_9HYPH|nr:hypothetical protein SAMN05192530_10266 [Aureimonas jatrophae]
MVVFCALCCVLLVFGVLVGLGFGSFRRLDGLLWSSAGFVGAFGALLRRCAVLFCGVAVALWDWLLALAGVLLVVLVCSGFGEVRGLAVASAVGVPVGVFFLISAAAGCWMWSEGFALLVCVVGGVRCGCEVAQVRSRVVRVLVGSVRGVAFILFWSRGPGADLLYAVEGLAGALDLLVEGSLVGLSRLSLLG